MDTQHWNENMEFLWEIVREYGLKLAIALVILIVGWKVIKLLDRLIKRVFDRRKIDLSLRYFLESLIDITMKVMLIIMVMAQAGIKTTSFIAVLGAAGLALGMALQGSLSNFAGGALILFFKPFKVGDLIEAQGLKGEVKEIQIFVTKLIVDGNKTAIIPNGILANEKIINYNEGDKLRVDVKIGISYSSDIDLARKTLMDVLYAHPDILNDPLPTVQVLNLGDSAVELLIRPWTIPSNYWAVHFYVMEEGKKALDKAGITIPFPQRDVHIYEHKPE
jgi:small conductance mechanosensitive channel